MFYACIIYKNIVSTFKIVNLKYECKNLNKNRIQSLKKKTDKDSSILMRHGFITKKVFTYTEHA